jgi:hypothetical protein
MTMRSIVRLPFLAFIMVQRQSIDRADQSLMECLGNVDLVVSLFDLTRLVRVSGRVDCADLHHERRRCVVVRVVGGDRRRGERHGPTVRHHQGYREKKEGDDVDVAEFHDDDDDDWID